MLCLVTLISVSTQTLPVIFSNNKQWMMKELNSLLNNKKRIFYTIAAHDKKVGNKYVEDVIREGKKRYKDNIELQLPSSGQHGIVLRTCPLLIARKMFLK